MGLLRIRTADRFFPMIAPDGTGGAMIASRATTGLWSGYADGQRAVLRATLGLLESATGPDTCVELPFHWPETVAETRNASEEVAPSPIAALLLMRPWLIPKLYSGRIPA
jgi:hypothetical protein